MIKTITSEVINNLVLEAFEENGQPILCDEYDKELEFDSLTFVSLIVSIEDKLGIEIPEEVLWYKTVTFNKLIDCIIGALSKA